MLARFFQLKQHNTSIKTEIVAGCTTFFTLVYIIFVTPQILQHAGINPQASFVATCIVAAIASCACGLFSNIPVAIAPAMGTTVFFTFELVGNQGYSWQTALAISGIAGCLLLIISFTRLRRWVIDSIPKHLSVATSIGIGFFLVLIALVNSGLISSGTDVLLTMHKLAETKTLLFALGFLFIVILDYYRITGAIIIGIVSITLASIALGINHYQGACALPPSILPSLFQLNIHGILTLATLPIILSYLLVILFDGTGSLIGLLQEDFFKSEDKSSRIAKGLFADSIGTITGSLLGTAGTAPFIESAAGIRAGGRTGLTAVTVAFLFILALFFAPLTKTIPAYATATALFYVGTLMIRHIQHLAISNLTDYIPCLTTIIMIPFSYSIPDGIGLGIISHVILKVATRKFNELNPLIIILSVVFVLYFMRIGS